MAENGKELWRERWLECVNELTSLELQMKSWLDTTQTNPHWSFIEFMCIYFDDLHLDDHYQYFLNKGWITSEEFEIIKDWHEALDKYKSPRNDDHDRQSILNDPKWREIVEKGINSKNKLVEVVSSKEKQILTKEIDYLKYV